MNKVGNSLKNGIKSELEQMNTMTMNSPGDTMAPEDTLPKSAPPQPTQPKLENGLSFPNAPTTTVPNRTLSIKNKLGAFPNFISSLPKRESAIGKPFTRPKEIPPLLPLNSLSSTPPNRSSDKDKDDTPSQSIVKEKGDALPRNVSKASLGNTHNKTDETEAGSRMAEALTDASLTTGQPLQTFVLRKLESPEAPRKQPSLKKKISLSNIIPPRKQKSHDSIGDQASSDDSQNSLALVNALGSDETSSNQNLTPPRDLGSIKSRSDSALSTISPLADLAPDPRQNASHNNLSPDYISNCPRRDSAWTAEVLSIEIQVDYVMDPEELWGHKLRNRQLHQDENDNEQTLIFDFKNMEPTPPDNSEKEVGVVLPMVAGSGDDGGGEEDGDDKKNEDNPIDNDVPPEKVDPPMDPRRGSDDLNLPPREHWENRFQFLLSTIGYAVDLSNVWRFPFLCYKNGGGAFLIPYFTTLFFGAMPVFFMEMCLGQFNRCGPTAIWEKMAPMFKGIGMASCFMAYIVAFYYNVIIAWSFFYLFASFTSELPWTTCFNSYNSDNCWQIDWDTNVTAGSDNDSRVVNADNGATVSPTESTRPLNWTYNVSVSISSTMEFFERGMLELHESKGLEDLGVVKWQLVLCTFLTFTVLYFCLWKGVKSTGKVVYVTATLPYVIMTILLIRGVMLPGAENGIRYFITPKIDSLRKPKVWIDAAVQIFFSVGSGFGTHIAYASYNKFHNDCKRDCVVTVIVNSFTSLFSGFVIFSYLGYMSLKTHKDIDKVATEGPGLVFIVYPEAIATLPGSVGWSIIFFFMLLALGLDSAFGGLESPLTGIRDELSQLMKYRYFREILTLLVILSAFIFSIPCLMQGGMYVFTILDTFAAGTSIVFIVLCEVVAVSWFYGMPQFCADVEKMTGEKPSMFWRICWKFICPLLLTTIVISSIISYQPLTYRHSKGTYTYPYYANIVGWCIACSSMMMVPGYVIYKLIRSNGSCRQSLALSISPKCEHEEIEQKQVVRRFQRQHWISI